MIRFVDITDAYELDDGRRYCMFINTVTDCCVLNGMGMHVCDSLEDVKSIPEYGARCVRLLPQGFFDVPATESA